VTDVVLTPKHGDGGPDRKQTRDDSLTAMRLAMVSQVDAVVAVGDKLHRGTGFNPGMLEELTVARWRNVPCIIVGAMSGVRMSDQATDLKMFNQTVRLARLAARLTKSDRQPLGTTRTPPGRRAMPTARDERAEVHRSGRHLDVGTHAGDRGVDVVNHERQMADADGGVPVALRRAGRIGGSPAARDRTGKRSAWSFWVSFRPIRSIAGQAEVKPYAADRSPFGVVEKLRTAPLLSLPPTSSAARVTSFATGCQSLVLTGPNLAEKRIAPGDEIVEIRHDRGVHVRDRPGARDQVWAEGVVAPRADGGDRAILQVRIVARCQDQQRILDVLDLVDLERLALPESLRRRAVGIVGRIENIVEPSLRLGEVLVAAEGLPPAQTGRDKNSPNCRPSKPLRRSRSPAP
jgi:hypothetical protein